MNGPVGRKPCREEDEIRSIPACVETPFSSESDIDKIIEKAELYITTCYSHKLEEGAESNNHRTFLRSDSQNDNSLDKDGLKDFLRTEISPAQLQKQETSLLPGM